ncbi:5315_t:CDS:2 [Entrophospora sp. SA101]|nr:5315_t:CDS:2 [Entrophospora sp. SA101]
MNQFSKLNHSAESDRWIAIFININCDLVNIPIHLIGKQTIKEAFPDGLPIGEPPQLLTSSGASWDFQLNDDLRTILAREVPDHYEHYCENQWDKVHMPTYLFLAGAGSGKSRNANEFHTSVLNSLSQEHTELRTKIANAWIFCVSLENGWSLITGEKGSTAIGTRMLCQCLAQSLEAIITNYEAPYPYDVFELVAKHYKKKLEDCTIFLVVDGLHQLMSEQANGTDKNSDFYRTLTNIGDLAMRGVFCLPCITATSRAVFSEDDTLVKILISDCGGNARAMEALKDTIEMLGNLSSDVAQDIARVILTHKKLRHDQYISNIVRKTPEQLVQPGLIQFHKIGELGERYLSAPYIWIWILSEQRSDEKSDYILQHWRFDDYIEQRSKLQVGPETPPGAQFWQNFEDFVARFRCIKSRIFNEGEHVNISEMHTRAVLNVEFRFVNYHLGFRTATKQIDTHSTSDNMKEWFITCTHDIVNARDCQKFILNCASAPAGDGFVCLACPGHTLNEVHQYKHLQKSNFTLDSCQDECYKAASTDNFFLAFTTQKNCNWDDNLPPNSGIIHGQNWGKYFGPFAARAFIFSQDSPPDINSATYLHLQLIEGIGMECAEKIISKRPFNSLEEAIERTGIDGKMLKRFKFSSQ